MKDLRVIVRLKSNILISHREKVGLTQADMAKLVGVDKNTYVNIENLHRKFIFGKKNKWRKGVIKIADYLEVIPENLFPESINQLRNTRKDIEVDSLELVRALGENRNRFAVEPHLFLEDRDLLLNAIPCSGNERTQRIIKSRFGIDDGFPKTLEEIADEERVTKERVRQIEQKGLRKMRRYIQVEMKTAI